MSDKDTTPLSSNFIITDQFIADLKNPYNNISMFCAKFVSLSPSAINHLSGYGIPEGEGGWNYYQNTSESISDISFDNLITGEIIHTEVNSDYSELKLKIPYKLDLSSRTFGFLTYTLNDPGDLIANNESVSVEEPKLPQGSVDQPDNPNFKIALVFDTSSFNLGLSMANSWDASYLTLDISTWNIASRLLPIREQLIGLNHGDEVNESYQWGGFVSEHHHNYVLISKDVDKVFQTNDESNPTLNYTPMDVWSLKEQTERFSIDRCNVEDHRLNNNVGEPLKDRNTWGNTGLIKSPQSENPITPNWKPPVKYQDGQWVEVWDNNTKIKNYDKILKINSAEKSYLFN